jgi:hypothetical protein
LINEIIKKHIQIELKKKTNKQMQTYINNCNIDNEKLLERDREKEERKINKWK